MSGPELASHAVTQSNHRRAHQCDQCNKAFTSSHQLAQHSRVHSGEKPYTCTFCDRKFKQLSHVQQHTRLHTGERPYKCSVPNCGRSFIQLSNLQQHMKTHSPGVKDLEKKFFCHHCGKGFKSQNSLFAHQCKKHPDLISNGNGRIVTKYNCKLCGRAYSNEGSFKKHMEGHQQQQQQPPPQQQQQPQQPQSAYVGSTNSIWSCSVCSSAFQDEFGLISHLEQMRTDPKHQFEAQLILTCAAASEKKQCVQNLNILASNLNNLVTGIGASDGGNDSNDDGQHQLNAQNLLQMSLMEGPSSSSNNIGTNNNNNTNMFPNLKIADHQQICETN